MTAIDNDASDSVSAGLAGVVGSYCIDPQCRSILNGSVNTGFSFENDNSSWPLALSVGWLQSLNDHIKLNFELDTAAIVGDVNDVSEAALAWYGIRFASESIGVDLGAVKLLCSNNDCDIDELPFGIPWVSFTYRQLGRR